MEQKYGKEIKSIDDLVLIHMTKYLPINGVIKTPKSTGLTFEEEFNGVKYEVKRQRETVHFCVNGEVAPNINRAGDGIKYAIVIPLKDVKRDNFIGGTTVDFYSRGDVAIPDGAYVLCSESEQELVQKQLGENINVVGFEGEFANGKADELIKKLGYKKEGIGDWSWSNEQDNKDAYNIMSENGWKINNPHSFSKEMATEMFLEDVERTAKVSQIMRQKGFADYKFPEFLIMNHHNFVGNTIEVLENDELKKKFYKKMEEIGIPIPDSVIEECESIKEGKMSDEAIKEKVKECLKNPNNEKYFSNHSNNYGAIADEIIKRRVIGEVRLAQIADSIKQNETTKFEDLLEMSDDILYDYTTEDRREEFLKSQGIELSNSEIKILGNRDLKNAYLEIEKIKDVPFKNLSPEENSKFWKFDNFYRDENIMTNSEFGENGHFIERGVIYKEGGFSQEEIDLFTGKYKEVIWGNEGIELNNKLMDENTSLAERLENYNNMIEEIDEVLANKEKNKIVSTETLGRQTLEEQKDTKTKIDMEQLLAQKMKEYTINQAKGVEK